MRVYLCDADELARPWSEMLSVLKDIKGVQIEYPQPVRWSEGEYQYAPDNGEGKTRIAGKSLVILHATPEIDELRKDEDEWKVRAKWLQDRDIWTLIISGAPISKGVQISDLIYRRAAKVTKDAAKPDKVFMVCLRRFVEKLVTTEKADWRVVEPDPYPPNLVALYLLLVAENRASLRELPEHFRTKLTESAMREYEEWFSDLDDAFPSHSGSEGQRKFLKKLFIRVAGGEG